MAVSQETLTILGVGIALAGIIFASNGQISDRIDRLDARLDRLETRIGRLETRMDRLEIRVDRLDVRLAAVEKETARIIGFLEGSDITGLPLPSHGAPAEADGAGVEPLLPRTSLSG